MATYVFETMTAAAAAAYDASRDEIAFSGAPRPSDVMIIMGADTITGERRSAPSPRRQPDASPAGLERLRQAQMKRARKAAQQGKGMSHGA